MGEDYNISSSLEKYSYKFDPFCDMTGIYVIRFKIKIAHYLRDDKI